MSELKVDLQGKKEEKDAKAWKLVYDRLRSRQMPPPDRPQPTAKERERLTNWLEDVFARHDLDGRPDPGPLRPRRLNVREHRNSLRDLAVVRNSRVRRANYAPTKNGHVSLYDAVIPPPEHPRLADSRFRPQGTVRRRPRATSQVAANGGRGSAARYRSSSAAASSSARSSAS